MPHPHGSYNGHKNWNHWNVSLWINNDEPLYRMALEAVRRTPNKKEAAKRIMQNLREQFHTATPVTPDGAAYSVTTIRAAISEMI
jgi:hypothetical protein